MLKIGCTDIWFCYRSQIYDSIAKERNCGMKTIIVYKPEYTIPKNRRFKVIYIKNRNNVYGEVQVIINIVNQTKGV